MLLSEARAPGLAPERLRVGRRRSERQPFRMEYVDGETLESLLGASAHPRGRGVRIAASCARASRRCDRVAAPRPKPSNVMLDGAAAR
jgi:hypothetical protein